MDKDNLNNFQNNLEYILKHLTENIKDIDNLDDKIYFELSKKEILESFNNIYLLMSKWENYYKLKQFDIIINEYKKVESLISQLELCLVNYEKKFHMNGISYSLYEIGKILINIKIEGEKNVR